MSQQNKKPRIPTATLWLKSAAIPMTPNPEPKLCDCWRYTVLHK